MNKITLLFVLCSFSLYKIVQSALIASGDIEQCIREDPEEELDCDTKVVVSVSLTQGQGNVESLQAELTEVKDIDGQTRELQYPVEIHLSKSDVYVRYPLTYEQSFPNKVSEIVIQATTDPFGILRTCVDDDDADSPTCGWKRDSLGRLIDDSQGFCCGCSALSGEDTRGAECEPLGPIITTAHCLDVPGNSGLWYSAYSLGAPEIHFTITTAIARQTTDSEIIEV